MLFVRMNVIEFRAAYVFMCRNVIEYSEVYIAKSARFYVTLNLIQGRMSVRGWNNGIKLVPAL